MAEEDDPPPESATVFVPRTAVEPPATAAPSADGGETVYAPSGLRAPTAAPEPSAVPSAPGPRAQGTQVAEGMVLNGMFRIKRFHARGGMAEVYEGVNVNDEADQVAIKVMLPALAADPNVQSLFMSEARTLMRMSHPALVQYRVLAQEPTLGLLYIVTEFINGPSLAAKMGTLEPTSTLLAGLTRRLAEGLRAAHELGAVHRDMSPDNVLLPDGRLDRAKIVDFGIAKSLDPGSKTTIGDGFAGKLGYVAPEQFGEYDRQIGPWTDIYSLALVILSVAMGRNVDMGATLYEAVTKRAAGPDLSPLPADLRPVFERMLVADPAERLRSMDEVIAALDGRAAAPPVAAAPVPPKVAPPPPKPPKPARGRGGSSGLLIGGVVAAVVVLGGIGVLALLTLKPAPKTTAAPPAVAQGLAPSAAATPDDAAGSPAAPHAEAARQAIAASLLTIPCSWLDLVSSTDTADGVAVKLTGVAGSTADAQTAIAQAIKSAGAVPASIDIGDVDPIDQPVCSALDTLRPFRADTSVASRRLVTSQTTYTMDQKDTPAGKPYARAVIDMRIGDPHAGVALLGMEQGGAIQKIIGDRGELTAAARMQQVQDLGGDNFRFPVKTDNVGWSGMMLLTGNGAFNHALLETPVGARNAAWQDKVAQALRAGGWKVEMVWYQSVLPRG